MIQESLGSRSSSRKQHSQTRVCNKAKQSHPPWAAGRES